MTGYESKRAAAQDKLDDNDDLTIAYQSGYYDGKKAAQPERTLLEQYDLEQSIEYRKGYEDGRWKGFGIGQRYAKEALAQPAQEPVAHLCGPDENGLFGLPTEDKACKDCFPVYRQSPQRTWVGLTDESITQVIDLMPNGINGWMSDWDLYEFARAVLAKSKEKNT